MFLYLPTSNYTTLYDVFWHALPSHVKTAMSNSKPGSQGSWKTKPGRPGAFLALSVFLHPRLPGGAAIVFQQFGFDFDAPVLSQKKSGAELAASSLDISCMGPKVVKLWKPPWMCQSNTCGCFFASGMMVIK